MAESRWYAALLVLAASAGPSWDNDRLSERQLRLVRAPSPDAAYRRACELGKASEHSYRNSAGEDVTWRFVGLAELVELDDSELRDGSEVISSFSSMDAELLVRPREELAVFWAQRNADVPARDLLG
jgi:uncharacterized protein DUF4288